MAKLPSGIEVRGDAYRVRIRRRGYPDQTATFPTLGEAKVWKEKIEGEMAGGGFLDGKKLRTTLLKDLILRYVEEVTPKKKGAVAETYILDRVPGRGVRVAQEVMDSGIVGMPIRRSRRTG